MMNASPPEARESTSDPVQLCAAAASWLALHWPDAQRTTHHNILANGDNSVDTVLLVRLPGGVRVVAFTALMKMTAHDPDGWLDRLRARLVGSTSVTQAAIDEAESIVARAAQPPADEHWLVLPSRLMRRLSPARRDALEHAATRRAVGILTVARSGRVQQFVTAGNTPPEQTGGWLIHYNFE